MARPLRVFIPDVSMHVIHRGNNRMALFQSEDDYRMLLTLLQRAIARHGVAVHGYVLMTNHFHLLATPERPTSLSGAIKELAGRYARYFNERYQRIGTVWNGRYRAIHVQSELYLLTCLRYIEQNPVRAQMVARAQEYPWSSYASHALGRTETWLTPHYVYQALGRDEAMRRHAYRTICGVPVTADEIVPFQQSRKRPIGVGPVSDPNPRGVRHRSDPEPLVQCADCE